MLQKMLFCSEIKKDLNRNKEKENKCNIVIIANSGTGRVIDNTHKNK